MAELQIQSKRGCRPAAAPRIDLTPMVDLGFLLITFFIMTTTMAKPKAMDIQMPYQPPGTEPLEWYASSAITLMPAKDHKIFYYEGEYKAGVQLQETRSMQELRTILQQKQQSLLSRANPRERELQVLIKAHATATTDDIVALFDEMSILQVKYFAMVDIYPGEAALVANGIR